MFYYLFAIFFIIFYLVPFGAMHFCLNKNPGADFVWQSAMEAFFIAFGVYLLFCLARFLFFLVSSIFIIFHQEKFNKLFRYNSVILLILFILDNLLLIVANFNGIYTMSDSLLFGYLYFMLLFTLSSAYFPFWLVFATRNTFVVLKKWLEELKRMRKR